MFFVSSFENTGRMASVGSSRTPSSTSFRHGVLEPRFTWTFPEASLRIWMLAVHAGITKTSIFMFCRRAEDHQSLRGQGCFLCDRREDMQRLCHVQLEISGPAQALLDIESDSC